MCRKLICGGFLEDLLENIGCSLKSRLTSRRKRPARSSRYRGRWPTRRPRRSSDAAEEKTLIKVLLLHLSPDEFLSRAPAKLPKGC